MQNKTKEAICNKLHQQLLEAISETRNDEVEKIQEELESTREQLEQAKKQLVDMRRNVATYRRVMAQELGMDVNPHEHVVFGTNWRDRAQELICLKSGMLKLVDALRQTGLNNLVDPECEPEMTSASAENLLTEKQRKSLRKIYEDYCVFRTQGEERAAETIEEYIKLKTSYQEKLKHNRIMIEEIKALKKKIDEVREKAKEDKRLMQFLIIRPTTDSHPVTLTLEDPNGKVDSEETEKKSSLDNMEMETFKAKWKANEQEKETAKEVICQFKKRIQDTKKKIFEAERLCARNMVRMQELQREIQNLKSPKITKREREEPKVGKITAVKFRAVQDQLQIAKSENRALRKFLNDAFLFKEPECKHLHLSLNTSVDIYRRDLEEALRQLWAKGGTTV